MSNRILPLLAAAMSIGLSGCFMSDQPRFELSSAVPAFGEGGRYEVLEHVKDSTYSHQEFFMVRHLGDGSYEFVNEKGEVLPISFHRLASDLFVGQAKPDDKDKPGYGYVVVRTVSGEVLVYAPQCDSQDKAKLTAYKVEFRGRYDCFIDGVANPLEMFATLNLGEPISKMVRE